MKTDMENTYNEDNVHQLGLDWDEYEEMMAEANEQDHYTMEYGEDYVQRCIRNWDPQDTDVNSIAHWIY